MYRMFFICSAIDSCLGCFHALATVNSTAMNIRVHASFLIRFFIFSRYMLRCFTILISYSKSLLSQMLSEDLMYSYHLIAHKNAESQASESASSDLWVRICILTSSHTIHRRTEFEKNVPTRWAHSLERPSCPSSLKGPSPGTLSLHLVHYRHRLDSIWNIFLKVSLHTLLYIR